MAARHRLTIRSIDPDPRAVAIERSAAQLGITAPGGAPIQGLAVADVIFIDGELTIEQLHALHAVLVDPLIQRGSWDSPNGSGVEVSLKPGVTDSIAGAVHHAADRLGLPVSTAASALRVEFHQPIEPSIADTIVARLVANPIVEQWVEGTIEPQFPDRNARPHAAARIDVASLDAAGLDALDRERSLSLDPEELIALRDHYAVLGRDATDVEIETIAQTWSEHCSHKTFRALIDVVGEAGDEPDASVETVEPLLAQLRRCTDAIAAPFVTSAFDGNAGIVQFTKHGTIALKAETHNHPSAVEPFGGANTGVGGVIRDVLGAAHRPIAVTDILCFGSPDLPLDELPAGSLHPRRVREGVIDGIADYGNKIGLPTVAGAILYDDAYTTNPLVFAGCIGTAPPLPRHEGPHRGDRVLLLGGATGRDGIRGATFSSATMDATTGEVAGASVQIGDPIVEKLLIDALVGAEDLYSAITDCGAGGLSSAVGEMAEGIGADIDLDTVPRKYPGLEPWEVWLSEAQERMVVAVAPRNVSALERRCARVGVALADIGRFTGDGRLVVRADGDIVAELDTAFLHDGRPQRRMRAEKIVPSRGGGTTRTVGDPAATLLALLAHRNIASKATTIHRYDHEILGATLVRPLVGVAGDAPADGVVLADPTADHGVAIGIGVNPWYGLHDPEAMAYAVVDEAIRNVVAVGADPDKIALLDNFSWGDPRRPSTLGALVAAVEGCCGAALMHSAPFVSGKDSLNNEYVGRDGKRHAVPPTLVITAVGHVPDPDRCVTPDLAAVGNVLVLLGTTDPEFAGSHLDLVLGPPDAPGLVPGPDPDAPDRYRRLHSAMRAGLVAACHDVSEGGLAVALAEMCIGGRIGATIDHLPHDDVTTALFSESAGRLVVELDQRNVTAFTTLMSDQIFALGTVDDSDALTITGLDPIPISALVDSFAGHDDR